MTGSYVPVFRMVGVILVLGAAILSSVSFAKKCGNRSKKEEIKFCKTVDSAERGPVVLLSFNNLAVD